MNKDKRRKKKNLKGTAERPRISVFRSNKNIFVQIIDDATGNVLTAASSLKMKQGGNVAAVKEVGQTLAKKAKEKKIDKVVFDRGRYVYKGRIKALAETLRAQGLQC